MNIFKRVPGLLILAGGIFTIYHFNHTINEIQETYILTLFY